MNGALAMSDPPAKMFSSERDERPADQASAQGRCMRAQHSTRVACALGPIACFDVPFWARKRTSGDHRTRTRTEIAGTAHIPSARQLRQLEASLVPAQHTP